MRPSSLSDQIVSLRGPKNSVDPLRPYAYLIEYEMSRSRLVESVATVFLANRECPYRCLMCDLWKNTTDETVPIGAIPTQIKHALENLDLIKTNRIGPERASKKPTSQIKLYNSGNFFDAKAIPPKDLPVIADGLNGAFGAGSFENIIVENHPQLCTQRVVDFKKQLNGTLEIAIGLETIHPKVISKLNKQMTLDDFRRSVEFLVSHDMFVRCFILLRPPFLSEEEGIEWALKSIEFAYSAGVECCAVIPTRSGNGVMNSLQNDNDFEEPKLSSLESVMEQGLKISGNDRRLFVDLWDAGRFSHCEKCCKARVDRLGRMNDSQSNDMQSIEPAIECECESMERNS